MKKLSLYLLLLLFGISFLHPVENDDDNLNYDYSIPITISYSQCALNPHNQLVCQEGFLENTLVTTPFGHRHIQDLHVSDIIFGSDNSQQGKIVTDIFSYQASQFVQLTKNSYIITAACQQKFYAPLHDRWIPASDIIPSDILLLADGTYFSFDDIEIIDQQVKIYCITLCDHLYQISEHDLVVHNMDAAFRTFQFGSMYLGSVTSILLQTTLSLVAIQWQIEALFKDDGGVFAPTIESITATVKEQRAYYDKHKKDLVELRTKFTTMYREVSALYTTYPDKQAILACTLSYDRIPRVDLNALEITLEQEVALTELQRYKLRQLRQNELLILEQDIYNLQITLAFQFDEYCRRMYASINEYNEFVYIVRDVTQFVETNKIPMNTPYDKVAAFYKCSVMVDVFLNDIDLTMGEFSTICQYYQTKCKYTDIIKAGTNIYDVIASVQILIQESKAAIAKTRPINNAKCNLAKAYFLYNKTSAPQVLSDINNLKARQQNSRKQSMAEIKAIVVSAQIMPPNDPEDPKNKNKHPHGKYKEPDEGGYHSDKGSSTKSPRPKDGQKALDNSYEVDDITQRVAIEEDHFVVLQRTLENEYHGYIADWDSVVPELQKILRELKLVHPKSGKIL